MRRGIRLTTGAEFALRDAIRTPVQLGRAEPIARDLFPLAERLDTEAWMGSRPCTPDMMPVIGRAPRHANLWFAFGHAHHGLTLGPVTGQADRRDDDRRVAVRRSRALRRRSASATRRSCAKFRSCRTGRSSPALVARPLRAPRGELVVLGLLVVGPLEHLHQPLQTEASPCSSASIASCAR